MAKQKFISISQNQAINIRAILQNCQRMVESLAEGQDDFSSDIKTIGDAMAGLSEMGELPPELKIFNPNED